MGAAPCDRTRRWSAGSVNVVRVTLCAGSERPVDHHTATAVMMPPTTKVATANGIP